MSDGRIGTYLWKASLAVILVGIGAGGFFWLSQSPVLAVDDIVVEGNHYTSTEEIMEKAGPLLRDQSLVRPQFDTVRAALGELPFIENVEFERDFPNTVIVRIREYRPLVCLQGAGGKNFVLSSEGRVLSELNGACPVLPVLSTKEPCLAQAGRMSECEDALVGARFLGNIPASFNYEFSEVSVADGDIRAKTNSGVGVHFGSLDDYGLKFEVLRQMLARSVAAGVQVTIDVSVPERPVTKEETPPAAVTTSTAAIEETAPAATEPVPEAGQDTGLPATGQTDTAAPGTGGQDAGTGNTELTDNGTQGANGGLLVTAPE
ncbi:MAG: FtsQ-type POTRA domain-containing protein [Thermoleophilia bacterium]|nr:FtsQ-type POTRA domain-containing protein [Thermoleophilia bacterium]